MALSLTLKPQERVILGDAVVRNASQHAARLTVETSVPVLKERDILTQDQVRTPCGHLYLAVQLLYLEPSQIQPLQELFLRLTKEVLEAAPSLSSALQEISLHVAGGDYYRALQAAKRLLQLEKGLLPDPSPPRV